MRICLNRRTAVIIVVLFLVLSSVLLTACSDKYEGSPYTGKWKCVSAQMQGAKIRSDKVVSDFYITLGANGKAVAVINGKDSGGEWEKTDLGFVIRSGDEELEFIAKDDSIVYSAKGIELLFEKDERM